MIFDPLTNYLNIKSKRMNIFLLRHFRKINSLNNIFLNRLTQISSCWSYKRSQQTSIPVLARCTQQLKIRPLETPLWQTLPNEAFIREMPFLNRKNKTTVATTNNKKPHKNPLLKHYCIPILMHTYTNEINSSFSNTLKFKADW